MLNESPGQAPEDVLRTDPPPPPGSPELSKASRRLPKLLTKSEFDEAFATNLSPTSANDEARRMPDHHQFDDGDPAPRGAVRSNIDPPANHARRRPRADSPQSFARPIPRPYDVNRDEALGVQTPMPPSRRSPPGQDVDRNFIPRSKAMATWLDQPARRPRLAGPGGGRKVASAERLHARRAPITVQTQADARQRTDRRPLFLTFL